MIHRSTFVSICFSSIFYRIPLKAEHTITGTGSFIVYGSLFKLEASRSISSVQGFLIGRFLYIGFWVEVVAIKKARFNFSAQQLTTVTYRYGNTITKRIFFLRVCHFPLFLVVTFCRSSSRSSIRNLPRISSFFLSHCLISVCKPRVFFFISAIAVIKYSLIQNRLNSSLISLRFAVH